MDTSHSGVNADVGATMSVGDAGSLAIPRFKIPDGYKFIGEGAKPYPLTGPGNRLINNTKKKQTGVMVVEHYFYHISEQCTESPIDPCCEYDHNILNKAQDATVIQAIRAFASDAQPSFVGNTDNRGFNSWFRTLEERGMFQHYISVVDDSAAGAAPDDTAATTGGYTTAATQTEQAGGYATAATQTEQAGGYATAATQTEEEGAVLAQPCQGIKCGPDGPLEHIWRKAGLAFFDDFNLIRNSIPRSDKEECIGHFVSHKAEEPCTALCDGCCWLFNDPAKVNYYLRSKTCDGTPLLSRDYCDECITTEAVLRDKNGILAFHSKHDQKASENRSAATRRLSIVCRYPSNA
jgi:hypothetical protein